MILCETIYSMTEERSHARIDAASEPELSRRRALVARDPAALAELFDAHFERIYALARRMVRDEHLAEDLTQEIFLRIHRALSSYDPARALRPWIFTIASNVIRDHLRSRAFGERRSLVSIEDDESVWTAVDESVPARELERAEERSAVAGAIDELSPSIKQVFLLRHGEGLDFATIAQALKMTEAAARQRFSRAVRVLRDSLARDDQPTERSR